MLYEYNISKYSNLKLKALIKILINIEILQNNIIL